jgi:hypothetical protein
LTYSVVAYRAADYETPLWAFPNLSSGRFNVEDAEPATQYLALHPMAPWAELIRNLNLRDADDAKSLRNAIWALKLELTQAPLELDFDTVQNYGVGPEELVGDDHAPTRRLARALYADGIQSFIAPSAALPGTANLIVLRPAVVIDYHAEPIDPEYEWPTALAARDAGCPIGLWDLVHHKGVGNPHPALAAWQSSDEFPLVQPSVPYRT